MLMRKKSSVSSRTSGKSEKNYQEFNSGLAFLCLALILMALLYGGMTWHIMRRGHASRRTGHLEGDLSTHPHLQHHDLSSIFLEGLPPKRKKEVAEEENLVRDKPQARAIETTLLEEALPKTPTEPGIASEYLQEETTDSRHNAKKTAELEEFDPVETVRFLRRRMPDV
jgi:hypothetical protein